MVILDKLTYAGNLENLEGIEQNSRYRFIKGDVTDGDLVDDLFQEEEPWGIVNFAAESHVDRSILDPSLFIQTNVTGTQVLLEAARLYGVERFVQISTDEVYGDAETGAPFHEGSRLAPSSPYAASKAAADLITLAYRRTHGLPVLIVRSSNNYGPHQFPEKLIPLMIRNILDGRELPIYGDGEQRRNWLYVEDNCMAILSILERGAAGAIYNVAAEDELTNLSVVRAICRELAQKERLNVEALLKSIRLLPDRPGHDRRYAVDTTRVLEELGWAAEIPFDKGLERTISWYLSHKDWVKRVTSGEYLSYYESVYSRNWDRMSK